MSWHRERRAGFGLETTGTDPLEARIVTAAGAAVGSTGREPVRCRARSADPGVRIPDLASATHGDSGERTAEGGRPVREVADAVAGALGECRSADGPVVAHNARRGSRGSAAFRAPHPVPGRGLPAHAGAGAGR